MDIFGNIILKAFGQIKGLRVENVAVDPVSPSAGSFWYNTTDGVYRGFDGTSVISFASGGNTATILSKLNAVVDAAGLNSDGTLPSLSSTNYTASATSLFAALVALDAQAKITADGLTAAEGATTALTTKVGAIITAEGLNPDGTLPAYTSTNYLGAATSNVLALTALDAQVKTNADGIAANVTAIAGRVSKAGDSLTGNLTFGGTATVTGLAAPVNASDAATMNYVDNRLAGLSWKRPVVGVLADHTTFATALVVGDRILNSTDFKIYTVTADGDSGATATFDAGVMMNDADAVFDKSNETGYVYSGSAIVQFTGGGQIVAGVGLVKNGNIMDINLGAGVAQLPTDEVGIDVLADGGLFLTVNGTDASTTSAAQLSILLDGTTLSRSATGLKVAAAGITAAELNASVAGDGLVGGGGAALAVNPGTGIAITADAVGIDLTYADARWLQLSGGTLTGPLVLAADPTDVKGAVTKQYADAIKAALDASYFLYTSSGPDTTHVVTHNIGSKYCNVTVVDATDKVIIPDSISFDTNNQLTVTVNTAISCKVVVTGKYVAA